MGLDGGLASLMECGAVEHAACHLTLSALRTCCERPSINRSFCFRHSDWGAGFLCLDCNRWHAPDCAAKGVVEALTGIPHGICRECEQAGRLEAALQSLNELPLEALENIVEALRGLDDPESQHFMAVFAALRDLRVVRVPHAFKPRVSLALAARALQRIVAAAKTLQSGLEREFYELLSAADIEQEFRPQQPIPVEVAARGGAGRKGIVATPDFGHRSLPYLIFLDGRTAHVSETTLADDAEITAELTRMGFLVRRFRYHQLSPSHRAQTLATLRRDLVHLRSDALRKGLV